MSPPSDSLESLSSNTESDQRTIEVLSENSLSRLSETTDSTPVPTPKSDPRKPQLFKPGRSGNPAGRPKGVKNQITILKEALELKLRNKAAWKIEKVLDKAIELALAGDKLMIKLLLELHMSKASHQEDTTQGKSQVAVVIQNLTESSQSERRSLQELGSGPGKVIDVSPKGNPNE